MDEPKMLGRDYADQAEAELQEAQHYLAKAQAGDLTDSYWYGQLAREAIDRAGVLIEQGDAFAVAAAVAAEAL
jgi:hypothetical protein